MVIRLTVTSLPLDSPPSVVEPFPGARVVAIFHSGVSTPPCHNATLGNNAYSQGFRMVYTSPQALLAWTLSSRLCSLVRSVQLPEGDKDDYRADTTPAGHKHTHTHAHHHRKRLKRFYWIVRPMPLCGHAPLLSKSVAIPVLASNTLWRTFCRALSRGWLNFGYADTEEEHARIQRRNSSLSLSVKGQRPCQWAQKGWGWLNFSTRQSTPSGQGRIH